jgi:hypothetical protein
MKKYFTFICFILFLIKSGNAQNNLQFNQVKLITSTAETVPVGKVWKMENFLPSVPLYQDLIRQYNQETDGANRNFAISVNSNTIYLQSNITREVGRTGGYWSQDGYATSSSASVFPSPIWFPAGTTVAASTNIQYISVVEFNIIP